MFRAVSLPIISSLFTVHTALVYGIQVWRQLSSRASFEQDQIGAAVSSWSCSKAVFKPVSHIPVPSVQWINYWWWAEELPETRRVSCRSKFGKLVHLVGFIIKKFVTMHGHTNVKFFLDCLILFSSVCYDTQEAEKPATAVGRFQFTSGTRGWGFCSLPPGKFPKSTRTPRLCFTPFCFNALSLVFNVFKPFEWEHEFFIYAFLK